MHFRRVATPPDPAKKLKTRYRWALQVVGGLVERETGPEPATLSLERDEEPDEDQ
jgi:hypothetical protein